MNIVHHTVNIVRWQADPGADSQDANDPRLGADQGAAVEGGPEDGPGELNMTRLLLVLAAAVGLGAVLARSVVPDVTRYLRIRRM
jgi:hypothetical protein